LIRVGIVDDHPLFRLGLLHALERQPDLEVLWDLGSLANLDRMLKTNPVDVVLMDLCLGGDEDALAATAGIRGSYDDVGVIVISGSLDWDAASAARVSGAGGYLPKDIAVTDMVAAIRANASPDAGKLAFSDMLEGNLHRNADIVAARRSLTRREREVLSELRRGRTNKDIALGFGVSTSTVNKHVQQVLKKLRARTRAEAVVLVNAAASGRPSPVGQGSQESGHS
jgi:DNA-binding NarL/FixJ family response regulator